VGLVRRAAVLRGFHHRAYIVRRNLGNWSPAPCSDEFAPDVAFDLATLTLGRKLVFDEVLGDRGKGIGALALFRQASALLLIGRVDAFADQLNPMAGLGAGLLERERAVVAERPACWVRAAWKARDKHEGLAGRLRHTHAEAADDGVHHVVMLPRFRGLQRPQPAVGQTFRHGMPSLALATAWQRFSVPVYVAKCPPKVAFVQPNVLSDKALRPTYAPVSPALSAYPH
jgi:hypothetical protein